MVAMSENDADVVDLLVSQHGQIKHATERVLGSSGPDKLDSFRDLVRLLAVHEAAEEEVIHPAARQHSVSDEVVDRRLQEERQAEHMLAELYEIGVQHQDFDAKFRVFAEGVTEHTEREEKEEFGPLLLHASQVERVRLARVVRFAEAIAPTSPYVRVGESAMANLLTGPPLGLFDRLRNAIRDARIQSREA
nr:hemerythrin domain-containing protein [Nocardia tengchongensis]